MMADDTKLLAFKEDGYSLKLHAGEQFLGLAPDTKTPHIGLLVSECANSVKSLIIGEMKKHVRTPGTGDAQQSEA